MPVSTEMLLLGKTVEWFGGPQDVSTVDADTFAHVVLRELALLGSMPRITSGLKKQTESS